MQIYENSLESTGHLSWRFKRNQVIRRLWHLIEYRIDRYPNVATINFMEVPTTPPMGVVCASPLTYGFIQVKKELFGSPLLLNTLTMSEVIGLTTILPIWRLKVQFRGQLPKILFRLSLYCTVRISWYSWIVIRCKRAIRACKKVSQMGTPMQCDRS